MTRRGALLGLGSVPFTRALSVAATDIAVIESFAIYTALVGRRSWVLIELRTADGRTGLGDASANEQVPANAATVAKEVFEIIRGRSPFAIERLREAAMSVVAGAEPRHRRHTVATCSGIEQAMWDLQGKVLELPCYELFGGKLRTEIRNYANINRATRGEDRTPDGFAANARRGVKAGFDAFKLAPFDHIARGETDRQRFADGVLRGIAFVEAVREAIGPERDLLIDGHSRFGARDAIEVASRLEPFDLYWMEEMCASAEDLAIFNEAVDVQSAGGESLWGVGQFFAYIQAGAVDAVMPDVKFCGGMYELKKIAAMAEGAGLLASPHGPASPVGNMAAAHVCATLPNFDILELAFGEVPWRAETVIPAEDVRNGYLTVPDRPGLGYEMNPLHWARHDA